MSQLILASTSIYRRELLTRLRLPFEVVKPEVDETPLPNESPLALSQRLAVAKAYAVLAREPNAWVIGSDQAAELQGLPLGKSGNREAAIAQLKAMSGQQVNFHTGVCVANSTHAFTASDRTTVHFRELTNLEIERYVDAEQPYDCAGSFKSEGLGIALFESIESCDPTALIGLPLIALAKLLRQAGFELP